MSWTGHYTQIEPKSYVMILHDSWCFTLFRRSVCLRSKVGLRTVLVDRMILTVANMIFYCLYWICAVLLRSVCTSSHQYKFDISTLNIFPWSGRVIPLVRKQGITDFLLDSNRETNCSNDALHPETDSRLLARDPPRFWGPAPMCDPRQLRPWASS